MSLKDRITEDMKSAMRAKDALRLSAIRMLLAAVKQKEVDERVVVDDAALVSIIEKLAKQRKDSITAFEQADRLDLAEKERSELNILTEYLPPQLSDTEIQAVISTIIAAAGTVTAADMGKLMAQAKAQLAGKADMSRVSALIKAALAA